jgi:uncharacterized protein
MSIPKDILRENPSLGDWSILTAYRGSISHNMFVPSTEPTSIDDKDVMAVCVPPIDYYFGLKEFGSRGTKEIKKGEWDIVIYEARKFIGLLAQGNPNVLAMLWLQKQHYIKVTAAGRLLIDNKHLFIGRHVYKAFTGYAYSQLHRMTHMAHKGYMGEKRKGLVEKFGFDTKNSAHLVRLLRMGYEFLKDGELNVYREDAKQLLEIKRGEWTLEQVKAEAERGFKLAEEAYVSSTLPAKPDMDKVNELCVEIISLVHKGVVYA